MWRLEGVKRVGHCQVGYDLMIMITLALRFVKRDCVLCGKIQFVNLTSRWVIWTVAEIRLSLSL